MTTMSPSAPAKTSTLDLSFERAVPLTPQQLWQGWTTPSLITQWFTPAPWKTHSCNLDLRPGGYFNTVMRSPEGDEFPNSGCYLELVENQKLVWTNALASGYRPAAPAANGSFFFTATLTFTPTAEGSLYKAQILHATQADCQQHQAMNFEEGWGKALDQLVACMKAQ